MSDSIERLTAARSFDQARQQARRAELGSFLRGKENRLLDFETLRQELSLQNPLYRGIQEIFLSQIIGSVGRYDDFTREFLPLKDNMRERWIGVEALARTQGWPPIDVYKVGTGYFVKDGNHRTAIAKQMGNTTIEAHVWEFPEQLQFDTSADLDRQLIEFSEKTFMAETKLDQHIPNHAIRFTTPGRYHELLTQIEELRYKLSVIDDAPHSFEDTAEDWYNLIYLPTVQIIRESTLLADFPGRTEADLFVWLSVHRARLQEQYGNFDKLADIAQFLAEKYRQDSMSRVVSQVKKLFGSEALPPLAEPE